MNSNYANFKDDVLLYFLRLCTHVIFDSFSNNYYVDGNYAGFKSDPFVVFFGPLELFNTIIFVE